MDEDEYNSAREAYSEAIKETSQGFVDMAAFIGSRYDIPLPTQKDLISMVLTSQRNLTNLVEAEEHFFRTGIKSAALFAKGLA